MRLREAAAPYRLVDENRPDDEAADEEGERESHLVNEGKRLVLQPELLWVVVPMGADGRQGAR